MGTFPAQAPPAMNAAAVTATGSFIGASVKLGPVRPTRGGIRPSALQAIGTAVSRRCLDQDLKPPPGTAAPFISRSRYSNRSATWANQEVAQGVSDGAPPLG